MNQPFIIGITGGSGAGKTTFIRALKDQMNHVPLCIVSQDEYYKAGREQKKDDRGVRNFDLPDALDSNAFIRDIHRLIDGDCVVRDQYTFNNPDKTGENIVYEPAPVIVLEGLYILQQPELRELVDLKVFIHAKENIKVIRRIKRDRKERNYPLEDVLYRYEHHVLPSYEKHIKPLYDQADLIINNNKSFHIALQVLCGFLQDRFGNEKKNTISMAEEGENI